MPGSFDTTSWSVVLNARDGDSTVSRAALNALCTTYWPPLYAHVRRRGHGAEDARDLTQAFFCHLLSDDMLASTDRERGRFRTFLLRSMDNFLANEWHRDHAQRRGGDAIRVPLDIREAEERIGLTSGGAPDPRVQFDRQWARALLDTVMERLAGDFAAAGKSGLFEHLRPGLLGERTGAPYRVIAEETGLSETALKVAAHRLRKRFGAMLREEVARTVADAGEVEEELRYLVEVMASPGGQP